ncbi:class A sortase [Periweissella fabalis]|uniref:Class A sortase n=1 Tax=Periweissella fabalis TaxID=1070421 RepID=A0A7X6S1W1_9LACO|nr:class A sortase [Periweissella fabalis]MCM0599050.1 class A sortase [Periweissella fabalis]NKZ23330.1 class A sortase [Periweissella fabalis]
MKKIPRVLAYVGLTIVLIISLGLIFNQQIAKFALETYHPHVTSKSIQAAKQKPASFDWQKVDSVSSTQIIQARFKTNDANFIGYVAVPSMGIALPISAGTGGDNLALGAATVLPQQEMGTGNYVLASHMVYIGKNLLFSPLYYHKAQGAKGQKIYLTDLKHVYEYTTTEYKVVPSTAVQITNPVPGKKVITLFTCNYTHNDGRVVLRGELTKTMTWHETSNKVKDYFKNQNNSGN